LSYVSAYHSGARSSTDAHLAELGFDRGIVTLRNVYDPEAFGLLGAEVVPAVENLQAAGR
jgi:hypothetical protein